MKHIDIFSEIPQNLQNLSETHIPKSGRVLIRGNMDNLKFLISENGVRIEGSLPRYIYGSNFYVPDRKGIYQFKEKCSDILKVDIGKANITRLHIAQNLQTEFKPEVYYPFFGDANYYSRLKQQHSIYYTNSKRVIHIYDKGLEAYKKQMRIPTEFLGKNLLRIEYRLEKNIKKYLKKKNIQFNDLITKSGYETLIDNWKAAYCGIKKEQPLSLNILNIKNSKEFMQYYTLLGIAQGGGLNKALEKVEELRLLKAFKNREDYSRLKSRIRKLIDHAPKATENNLIQEISTKVEAVTYESLHNQALKNPNHA